MCPHFSCLRSHIRRYGVLLGAEGRSGSDDRALSQKIVQSLGEGVLGAWQQGKTKVFLREAMERELEEQRRRKLHMYAVIIQRVVSCLYVLLRYSRASKIE